MNRQEFLEKYTHESTVSGYTDFRKDLDTIIYQEIMKKHIFYNTVERPVICNECAIKVKKFKYSSKITYCPLCNQKGMF